MSPRRSPWGQRACFSGAPFIRAGRRWGAGRDCRARVDRHETRTRHDAGAHELAALSAEILCTAALHLYWNTLTRHNRSQPGLGRVTSAGSWKLIVLSLGSAAIGCACQLRASQEEIVFNARFDRQLAHLQSFKMIVISRWPPNTASSPPITQLGRLAAAGRRQLARERLASSGRRRSARPTSGSSLRPGPCDRFLERECIP